MEDERQTNSPVIPRSARLISPAADKSENSYSTAIRYEHSEKNPERGLLYIAIEVLQPSEEGAKLKDLIFDGLKEEYYGGQGSSDRAFEVAVQAVNDRLGDYAETETNEWVGKLSAVLAAVNGQSVSLTKTGAAEAYLFRRDAISQVSEGLFDTAVKPHPLKTFTNIATGTLEIGDKVVFTTPDLFHHVSLLELRQILAEYNPTGSIGHLARMLEQHERAKTSLIVLELTTPELVAHDFLPEGPSDIILQSERSAFKIPYLSGAKIFLTELAHDSPLSKLTPLYEKASSGVSGIAAKLPKRTRQLPRLNFSRLLSNELVRKHRRGVQLAAVGLAAVLAVSIGLALAYAPAANKAKTAERALATAKSDLDQAQTRKIYDRNGAKTVLADAINLNQEALANKSTAAAAAELGKQLGALYDELYGIVRAHEDSLGSADGQIENVFAAVSGAIAVMKNGQVARFGSQPGTLGSALPAEVAASAYNAATNLLYLALSDSSLTVFDTAKSAVASTVAAGSFEAAKGLAINDSNPPKYSLYTLANDGKVYTHTLGSSTGHATLYAAVDGSTIAIDKAVFLASNGSIVKLVNKRSVAFHLSQAPAGPINQIAAAGDNLYVLSGGNAITVYDLNGGYIKQYPLARNAEHIAAAAGGTLFYSSGNQVYSLK